MSVKAQSFYLNWTRQLGLLTMGLLSFKVLAQDVQANTMATEPIIASVVLNGTLLTEAQLLHRELGPGNTRVWIPEKEAKVWRMNMLGREHRQIEAVQYVAFCGSSDRCFYDETSALLTMTLENKNLLPLNVMPPQQAVEDATQVKSVGGYLNYDLQSWQTSHPGASILLEGRIYSPYGHGSVRTAGVVTGSYGSRTLAQAVWQVDRPKQGYSIQAGSISIPDTSLGAGLSLTGLRIGSNPNLHPTTTQMLRPRIDGLADRSERTDVFLDGLFRQTAQIPYGPYSIELQPQFPGRGSLDVISTDATGLQTRRTLSYYYVPEMLTPGATEWSADIGVLANDGRSVGANPPGIMSAIVRRGLNRQLTAQAQALLADGAARVVMAAETAAPSRGLSSAGLIWQRSEAQPQGQYWLTAGHEYLTPEFSASFRTEQSLNGCSSGEYTRALTDRLWRACHSVSSSISLNLGNRWSVAATLDQRRENSTRNVSVASLSARLQTGIRNQLGLTLQRITVNNQVTSGIFLIWSQPLGNTYDGQISLQQRSRERATVSWSAQSTPPADIQMESERLQTYGSVGEQSNVGVRWNKRAERADWRLEAQADSKGISTAVGVAGAVGYAEGRAFSSRRIDDAFIVVDVGLPNLPVLLDNREVARTNEQGWAIVTEGRAYQANNVGVDTSALPIEYAMPRDQQTVVPTSAGGVLAQFDLSDGGVSIPVRDDAGQPLPPGALVTISTQRLTTAVTSRSEVFFERSDRAAEVMIEWSGKRCRFNYEPQTEPPGGYRCVTLQ